MKNYYMEMKAMSVGYRSTPLIRDICIGIQKGDIITLIGPNGSGKSTILKSITGQLKLLGGQAVLDSENITKMTGKEMAEKMAVVLTDRIRPELMTCYDIVAMGRYPYTNRIGTLTSEDKKKIDEALDTVNAKELAEKGFETISDGQRQRILLARAICQEPDVIVLDEPTSFLDIRYKLELLTILKDMAKNRNITVIMSLHEIELAQKISDKIICVKGDTIFKYGTVEEVFHEDIIKKLYDIDNGYYDPYFGNIELNKTDGEPQVFVMSAAGSGIPVYRRLQKEGMPFAAGILYENDVDYQLAKNLAVKVISEKPFCNISDDTFAMAVECMKSIPMVIDAGVQIGDCNKKMLDLKRVAKEQGKIIL